MCVVLGPLLLKLNRAIRQFNQGFGKMLNAPAADRNKEPILSVLRESLDPGKPLQALEISSGTGQHVTHFAQGLRNVVWQPSEYDHQSLARGHLKYKKKLENWLDLKSITGEKLGYQEPWPHSGRVVIEAHRAHYRQANVKPAIHLDASLSHEHWGNIQPESLDLVLNINMIHISPMACTEGLFRGAGALLKPQGLLLTYGPYAVNGRITPQSNVDFDQSLRQRNSEWGLRDVVLLRSIAERNGLFLEKMVDMPANNKCLLFRKESLV